MPEIRKLLANNRDWAMHMTDEDPEFFERLASQHAPIYLWIGCSDSRVPATELVGLPPGQMFVHRNVANVVVHSDLNCLTVLQYAVDVLGVRHIIVCGHYGCGGVEAAFRERSVGLSDNWLRHVQDVRNKYSRLLAGCPDESQQLARLCELNVIEQVVNVCQTTIVQRAWQRGQTLAVHGWIYGLSDGLVRDLGMSVRNIESFEAQYQHALACLA